MKKICYIITFTFIYLISPNISYCDELAISSITKSKLIAIFGDLPINHSEDIRLKVRKTFVNNKGINLLEGDRVNIKLLYRGFRETPPQLIGVFLDGNKDPLVATITPGKSTVAPKNGSDRGIPLFSITGFADNYCWGKYTALVVVKIDKNLIANSKSFRTITADCGSHN